MREQPPQPRPYATPELRLYGSVRVLTASGSGMTVEPGNEICFTLTTRKHCN